MKLSKGWLATIIIIGVLLIDQIFKIWIKKLISILVKSTK